PFYVVASGSMVPVLNVNDLIVVWGKDNNTSFDSAKVGDIIVFKAFIADTGEKEGKTIVHRVASVFEKGETLRGNTELNRLCYPVSVPAVLENKTILTKGDANECSIPGVDIPITQENYVGRVVYTIPQVGIIPAILKPPVNYIIMALIGGLLVASFIKSNKKQEEKVKDE
ncbi:MAG: S26 family signal peptidase, partial [Nitrosopumilus sp.]|nr:S26 family signal peptidase [Nitrosopumilus sp.]